MQLNSFNICTPACRLHLMYLILFKICVITVFRQIIVFYNYVELFIVFGKNITKQTEDSTLSQLIHRSTSGKNLSIHWRPVTIKKY